MPTIPAPRRRIPHADRGAGPRSDRDTRRLTVARPVRTGARVVAWAAVLTLGWLLLPTQYGGHVATTVVSGHSMEPTYWTGDLVVTWRGSEVSPGDVVVYRVPAGEPGEGLHVVHRVVSVDASGRLTMLGDNNDEVDMWTPSEVDVVGEVVASVPQGGRWMQLLLSPLALAMLCGVLVMLAVVSDGRHPDDEDPVHQDSDDRDSDSTSGPPTPPGPPTRLPRPTDPRVPRPAPRQRHGGGVVVRALLTLSGVSALLLGLPVASAASLGGLDAADLFTTRVDARPVVDPLTEVAASVTVTSSDASSYCATVTVSTTSSTAVLWRTTIMPSTPGLTPAMRLDAQPTSYWNATSLSFDATARTWQVRGSDSNAYVRAGNDQTWGYCSPYSTSVPTTPAQVSVRITSESGTGSGTQYCAEVTVSTTSSEWVRWQATIGSTTPGLTATRYRLSTQPTNVWNATSVSFMGGSRWSWVLEGAGWNRFVKAGSPTTFGFCT